MHIMESLRRQIVIADQGFQKRRKMPAPKSDFGPDRQVEQSSIVQLGECRFFSALPGIAAIQRQAEPTIEVVCVTRPKAARIGLDPARKREEGSRQGSVNIRARVKERVSTKDLPFGIWRILCCCKASEHAEQNDCCKLCEATATLDH